jgi:uncharacterized protein with von Willebrand factor type A (vWA) domain
MSIKNNLFETLNWILKSKKQKPEVLFESNYLINRWLSMADSSTAYIINTTGNRWLKVLNNLPLSNFYHTILPSNFKRILYVKRKTKEKESEEYKNIADNMELSIKDIKFLENSLEDLHKEPK